MDDKKIERLLSQSWTPKPPAEMRERFLSRAGNIQVRVRRGAVLGIARWKLALAGAAIAVAFGTSLSDSARQHRVAAIAGQTDVSKTASAPYTDYVTNFRREMNRVLASASGDDVPVNGKDGGSL